MSVTPILFGEIEAEIMEVIKRCCWISPLLLWLSIHNAVGHPMPNSIVHLTILNDQVKGNALIPMRDLRSVLGVQTNLEELKSYFRAHIRPQSPNGVKWEVKITEAAIVQSIHLASGDYTELSVSFVMIPAELKDLTNFIFDYDVVCHQIVTHKVFVLVEQGKTQTASIIELDIPTEEIKPLEINMTTNNLLDNSFFSISIILLLSAGVLSVFLFSNLKRLG